MFLECRVLIGWAGCYIKGRQRIRAGLPVSLLQTADLVINRPRQVQPQLSAAARECPFQAEQSRKQHQDSRLSHRSGACTLAPTWSLGYASLSPVSFFSKYLAFKTNMDGSGALGREKTGVAGGDRKVGDYIISTTLSYDPR